MPRGVPKLGRRRSKFGSVAGPGSQVTPASGPPMGFDPATGESMGAGMKKGGVAKKRSKRK